MNIAVEVNLMIDHQLCLMGTVLRTARYRIVDPFKLLGFDVVLIPTNRKGCR